MRFGQVSDNSFDMELMCEVALSGKGQADASIAIAQKQPPGQARFVALCNTHHVPIRVLERVQAYCAADWIAAALGAERARIANALPHLEEVCRVLENNGCPTMVIKSLDHLPDCGFDLDLYTTAPEERVREVLVRWFKLVSKPRSWGDRLAHKITVEIEGLQTPVEIHHRYLGQTGEHSALATRFMQRRQTLAVGEYSFYVPAPEERVIAATLQRMYRHFFFRCCDVVNTAGLIDNRQLDFNELRRAANTGGVWPGVSSFLRIVADYIFEYQGRVLPIPAEVLADARVRGSDTFVRGTLLRVPLRKCAAQLYTHELREMVKMRDLRGGARLLLLPPLASAARLAYKLTGDHRGIW